MKSTLAPGISYRLQTQVHSHQLVPALFPDSPPIASMPRVLATAWLVALMEHACILALEPHLDTGEASVGTRVGNFSRSLLRTLPRSVTATTLLSGKVLVAGLAFVQTSSGRQPSPGTAELYDPTTGGW